MIWTGTREELEKMFEPDWGDDCDPEDDGDWEDDEDLDGEDEEE